MRNAINVTTKNVAANGRVETRALGPIFAFRKYDGTQSSQSAMPNKLAKAAARLAQHWTDHCRPIVAMMSSASGWQS